LPIKRGVKRPAPLSLIALRSGRGPLYLLTAGLIVLLGWVHAHFIGHYGFASTTRFSWELAYVAMLGVAAYAAGLPESTPGLTSAFTAAVGATASAAVGISIVQLLLGSQLMPRFVVFAGAIALVPGYVVCAAVATRSGELRRNLDRVVVVAPDGDVSVLRDDLAIEPEATAVLVGALSPSQARPTGEGSRPLEDLARSSGAGVVVLGREAQGDDSIIAQAARLHASGVRVRTLSLFYDEWLGKLPVPELERLALMFDIGEVHRLRYTRVKRVADIVVAVPAVLILGLLTPLVAVGNLLGNRGPLFFRQTRVGRSGKTFEILKFRTMSPGAPEGDWTCHGDPRVTPFGRWMRRSHLDELPQALNVLRGELSTVGPRPEQERYVAELTEKIPFYELRHLVRPGVTGWAQVKYPYGSSTADALEKLQYEFFYLRHQNLTLDLRIIVRTIRSVVGRAGR